MLNEIVTKGSLLSLYQKYNFRESQMEMSKHLSEALPLGIVNFSYYKLKKWLTCNVKFPFCSGYSAETSIFGSLHTIMEQARQINLAIVLWDFSSWEENEDQFKERVQPFQGWKVCPNIRRFAKGRRNYLIIRYHSSLRKSMLTENNVCTWLCSRPCFPEFQDNTIGWFDGYIGVAIAKKTNSKLQWN
ncbi:Uncharacterized protein Adt_07131 [Abeliophyllum distichum]|uniref:Uncharacterized protein n=1 Tax=Abeliophyllum distichum TaxID=126358 RepID=A0ABD1VB54_9LAMI